VAENRIVFGSPPILTLEVKQRLFPNSEHTSDRNMLAVNATVVAGRFRGFLEAGVRVQEIESLRIKLRDMYKRLGGEWHQEFLEPWLDLRFKGDGLGHFVMICVADDQPGTGNELRFNVAFDQTEIPEMLAALDEVMSNIPGSPE
jgi:hypothetical protein